MMAVSRGVKSTEYIELKDDWCEIYDPAEDVTSKCYGYRRSYIRTFCYVLGCVCSVGFLLLISHWRSDWHLFMTHRRCRLAKATKVLLVDDSKCCAVENVYSSIEQSLDSVSVNLIGPDSDRYFIHKHLKFYLGKNDVFLSVRGFEDSESVYNLHHIYKGIAPPVRQRALLWHRHNIIDVAVKSYFTLFFKECANPFYIFQVFSCILWFSDDYYYYASVIVLISLFSILISIYETRKQLITLSNMIAKSAPVSVLTAAGGTLEIDSESLVPGDVLVLPRYGSKLYCDAVLISGTVIVNESMLTGESVPVTKTPLVDPVDINSSENVTFNSVKHKRNTLFCGTEILQTRCFGDEKVLAVVVKTGFTTTKGDLIRSILFPKPVDFKFYTDAFKFIGVLGIFAALGFGYTIYIFAKQGMPIGGIIKKALDVITIAVPPQLPAAMSVGIVYALRRLRKRNIFCISPSRINISGQLNLFCFDKTGTLTEDGLEFYGVMRASNSEFFELEHTVNDDNDHATIAMATCHSLTTINGEICGDSLDIKMFHTTRWELEEPGEETERYENMVPLVVKPRHKPGYSMEWKYLESDALPLEVAIVKQFTFSSELQRMSVVTRNLGADHMNVYAKGSPEMISSLCRPETLPKSFNENLTSIAQKGYRVIAIAYKKLPKSVHWHKVQQFNRAQAECDLNFLGFVIMNNVLKPETAPIIEELYRAQIRNIMVTGDNMLTAISVARECGIVPSSHKIISITFAEDCESNSQLKFNIVGQPDNMLDEAVQNSFHNFLGRQYHFAVSGKVFHVIQQNYPELYECVILCGTIFARMLPDQKTSLVESLQKVGYGVGMCGDGANDCGALKRAHAGISLSEAEASIASPFTSKVQNIGCVPQVIREGRCALVTSFNIFKFMALYSMIQYCSVLLLYSVNFNLGDFQFLYIDFFIITPFAVTMGHTGPTDYLSPIQPLGRLMHPLVLASLILQILVQCTFQVFFFFFVRTLPEYTSGGEKFNYENTILFVATSFQYIIVALIFSPGRPHRQAFYKNTGLLLSTLVFVAFNCVLAYKPYTPIAQFMGLLRIDDVKYYEVVFGMLAGNVLASYIIDYLLLQLKCLKQYVEKREKHKYETLAKQFAVEPCLNHFLFETSTQVKV